MLDFGESRWVREALGAVEDDLETEDLATEDLETEDLEKYEERLPPYTDLDLSLPTSAGRAGVNGED